MDCQDSVVSPNRTSALAPKTAIARIIKAHDDSLGGLSNQEAAAVFDDYDWSTFKSSDGALSTLMVDGVQNVDDRDLRMAIASWRTVSRAAIADDEWVANQRHLLNLLYAYQIQLADVREILKRNLSLLRERARN